MRRSPESASLSDTAKGSATSHARVRRTAWIGTGVTFGLGLLLAGTLAAQNANFVTPGSSNRTLGIPAKDRMIERVDEAPWRTGIFRFSPWLGVRDASFVKGTRVGDGTEETDDFTATLGAGLRGYIRASENFLVAGHALPEYTWWADDEDRRNLNGRYGLGFFVFLNRLDFELSHRITEQQTFFSPEVRRLTALRAETTRGLVTIGLGSRFEVMLRGTRIESTSEEDEGPFVGLLRQLDRSEDQLQALVGYDGPRGWRFAVGFDSRSADFEVNARPLSNDADGFRIETGFRGNRFDGLLEVSSTDIEPGGDRSVVREASETTGALEGIWSLTERSALLTYARRTLNYSVTSGASYFISERYGVRLQSTLNRVGFGVFAEFGEDAFASVRGLSLSRVDDVTSFGGEANIDLNKVRLRLDVSSTDYSSSIPGLDRDITTIGISFEIEPLEKLLASAIDRLRFGDSAGLW